MLFAFGWASSQRAYLGMLSTRITQAAGGWYARDIAFSWHGTPDTIGAPPAVVNAVHDALAPLSVTSLDMPLTPRKVWSAIARAARGGD